MRHSLTYNGVPSWWRRPFGAGDTGPDVKVALRKLGLDPEAGFDALALARVKGLARTLGIWDHDGAVDERIASALGEAATDGLPPDWFSLRPGDAGTLVARAASLLGLAPREVYDEEMEACVRRLQSASRIAPTGVLNTETAISLGEA